MAHTGEERRVAAPGSVTIADVAGAAGVSTATVSRVLNGTGTVSEPARERVLAATRSLGYVSSSAAASLASGRTRNVGIVVPVLGRWFFSSVVEGAQGALAAVGYDVTLYNLHRGGDERERVFTDFLRRQRVDGVIAVALELSGTEVANLHSVGKPVVGLGGAIADVPTFQVDNLAIARVAAEHLIALGHRRIAHLGSEPDSPTAFRLGENRYEGYVETMRAHGLDAAPNTHTADFTVAGGRAAGLRMLSARDRPTAVFAASDEMAIGLLLAARELGLSIPRDLSIVGVDDHELSAAIGLTTVAQHPEQQGAKVADLLISLLNPSADDAATGTGSLPHDLIVRDTTAPPAP